MKDEIHFLLIRNSIVRKEILVQSAALDMAINGNWTKNWTDFFNKEDDNLKVLLENYKEYTIASIKKG